MTWIETLTLNQKPYHLIGTTDIGIYKKWNWTHYECTWVHQIRTLMWSSPKYKFWYSNLVALQILGFLVVCDTPSNSPTCSEVLQRGCVAILLCNFVMHFIQYSIYEGYMDARRNREIKCHSLSNATWIVGQTTTLFFLQALWHKYENLDVGT